MKRSWDNDYILLEEMTDSSNDTLRDSLEDPIVGRLVSGLLKKFLEGVPDSFTVDGHLGELRDNSQNWEDKLLDHVEDPVKDDQNRNLMTEYYSTDLILDSKGRIIQADSVFCS